ncbi:CaiB/BaiF CoA transferase family protein [Phreatobacter sp.]|uniref:CaiB/BaiF CoA transferase family protein n=1 Tax=Phreatobacter sp. TaxID=1966341 RepID=UPI003F6E68FA
MPRPRPSTALDHIRVLDLTRVRAGPTCCRVLADFGADVIKIEAPPGVDPNEGMSGHRHGFDMQNLHRNKRSLTLNLKTEEGRAVFLKLVETADVVVENYRPDVKDRMGIGYAALKAVNPRIILASVSGFGQTGPYRTRAGFDQIAQGMGGLMAITGHAGEGPMRAGIAVADSAAGIYAATGILVALAEREKSGEGQWVQTSLLQAQIAMCDFQAAVYTVDGKVPPQNGNDHPHSTPMGALPTADGHINVGVGGEGQWKAFCRAIGREDLAAHPDYVDARQRFRNRKALMSLLGDLFRTQPADHWLDLLEAEGVPAGPIYTMDQVFADPQVVHLGMATPVQHHARGEVRLIAQPLVMSRTPPAVATALPEQGEHTDEVLAEAGFAADEIARLRQNRIV